MRGQKKSSRHSYFAEDSEQRKEYFENLFFEYAEKQAHNNGVTLAQFLSQITGINGFRRALREAFSMDTSLSAYVDGMTSVDFRVFFERDTIQNLVNKNSEAPAIMEEFVQQELEVPVKVAQVNKETRVFMPAKVKGKRTIAYKDAVKVRGKEQTRYRDAKGRWASIK